MRWRVDSDVHELLEGLPEGSPERGFYERFLSEYYAGDGLRSDDALHNTNELRKACTTAMAAARRDVLTAHPEAIAEAQEPAADGNPRRSSTYGPADYIEPEHIATDSRLVAVLSPQPRRAGAGRQAAERTKQNKRNAAKSRKKARP